MRICPLNPELEWDLKLTHMRGSSGSYKGFTGFRFGVSIKVTNTSPKPQAIYRSRAQELKKGLTI